MSRRELELKTKDLEGKIHIIIKNIKTQLVMFESLEDLLKEYRARNKLCIDCPVFNQLNANNVECEEQNGT